MNWTAFPFSRGALAAALALIPGASFMTGCIEDTNLTGSNGGTEGAGVGGMGGTGATGATGGSSSMSGGGMSGSGMGGAGGAGGAEPGVCGNGKLEPGETCDDGNTLDGDACPGVCFHGVNDVELGIFSTCAILFDGRLKCWGRNADGELGLGDTEGRGDGPDEMGDFLPAVNLGAGQSAASVAVGGSYACALLKGGKVKCWGQNIHGQVGLGNTETVGDEPGEMGDNLPVVDLGIGQIPVAIAVGESWNCALLLGGSVKCWGHSMYGRLGLGDTEDRGDNPGEMGDNLPAVDLGAGKVAVALALRGNHTCALLSDKTVKCWGANYYGQLGLGDTEDRGDNPGEMGDNLPAVPLGGEAVAVAAGQHHTCALLGDGSVKCWGGNSYGELGLGDTEGRGDEPGEMALLPKVDLGQGKIAASIATKGPFNCALLNDGSVKCWGANTSGQLGLGDTLSRGDEPGEMGDNLPAVDLGTGPAPSSIGAGRGHICARFMDGHVKCWGGGSYGKLGYGNNLNQGDAPFHIITSTNPFDDEEPVYIPQMGDDLPFVKL